MRDTGGCGFYRCLQPSSFLNRAGLAESSVALLDPKKEDILSSNLVIIQAIGSVNAMQISKLCIENNIPYIIEIDDFLHHVSPSNLAGYPGWNQGTLYVHRTMEMARRGCGMTVSTNWLAREYFPYHNNIYVIPNYLDQDKWTNPMARKNDGKVRIGWAGGNAHGDDLLMISKVIEKIIKEFKGKVIFETFGMMPHELGGIFNNLDQFNSLCPKCGYEGDKHHHPGEKLEDYPMILASKCWDIALAPVINNAFGNAKSDLKIKEYSASGIPIIASSVEPYREAQKNKAQVILASSFDEWYNAIKQLIKDQARRDEMVRANKEWVEQYWIQDNIYSIFEVYQNIMNEFYGMPKK